MPILATQKVEKKPLLVKTAVKAAPHPQTNHKESKMIASKPASKPTQKPAALTKAQINKMMGKPEHKPAEHKEPHHQAPMAHLEKK